MLRILVVLLGIAVLLYVVVRLLQRRRPGAPANGSSTPGREPNPWATAAYQRAVRERAEQQRRGTTAGPAAAADPAPAILIEDGVFGYDDPHCENFVVISPAPSRAVADAVRRANDRFMLVDENGIEHADVDAVEAASDALGSGEDLYTPNYAADPKVTAAGVEGYVDCKGGIDPAMGATMRRVLREELERLGAPARVEVPRRD